MSCQSSIPIPLFLPIIEYSVIYNSLHVRTATDCLLLFLGPRNAYDINPSHVSLPFHSPPLQFCHIESQLHVENERLPLP